MLFLKNKNLLICIERSEGHILLNACNEPDIVESEWAFKSHRLGSNTSSAI